MANEQNNKLDNYLKELSWQSDDAVYAFVMYGPGAKMSIEPLKNVLAKLKKGKAGIPGTQKYMNDFIRKWLYTLPKKDSAAHEQWTLARKLLNLDLSYVEFIHLIRQTGGLMSLLTYNYSDSRQYLPNRSVLFRTPATPMELPDQIYTHTKRAALNSNVIVPSSVVASAIDEKIAPDVPPAQRPAGASLDIQDVKSGNGAKLHKSYKGNVLIIL